MSTQRLKVVIDRESAYDIRVGTSLLASLGVHTREVSAATKAVVITDDNVGPQYLSKVKASLSEGGFEVFDLTVPAGEGSKSIEVATELWEALVMLGIGRDALIVGLGGGVVGDLAGFVASTYMRGVDYVQVPTSLLAMVDSSIGGKTAINLGAGKNLVGTFWQPRYVLADLKTLDTLPAVERENGFAEIAKSALLDGEEPCRLLMDDAEALLAHAESATQQAIVRSLSLKARVVAADVREKGQRVCLNYGHTFAHALEAVSGYRISHGRAVAEGMRFAARLAIEAAGAPESLAEAQAILLDGLGLASIAEPFSADELHARMFSDKKVRNDELRFVFVTAPGQWKVVAVDPDLVKIYLILWEQERM
ncbi:MAG: 3-dehydroquinate synthase [Coriobacteriales bacterium]|jgi:3-dehydroquinate synthase|nr:3-dehydroquinate synthase [Coriobacteriales bacterium]